MALYISAGRRRRRVIVAAALALVVGMAAGLLIGRLSVTTPSEQARAVADRGRDLATRIDALTIEFEQAVNGTGDSVAKGVTEPLIGIERDLRSTLAKAPWLVPATKSDLIAMVAELRTEDTSGMSPVGFESATAAVSKALRSALGVR